MLQPDRIAYCFTLTHELPDVEFKGAGKGRDNPLFGRVVRAAIAMANRRGGGIIIIGVAETATGLSFDGLSSEELATWKYENIASGFNSYTSSAIEFERLEHQRDGKTFLILHIHEFASVPIMCTQEYRDKSSPKKPEKECQVVLQKGAFYIRTLNRPESKEMHTSEELRTLFTLSNDKAVQSFVTHTRLAGINILPIPQDKELFAQQLEGWTSPLLTEILSRGHWDIRIRPVTFQQERVPLSDLRQLLMRASLNYRGWEVPYITPRLPETGVDWISLEYQRENGLQAWRFFQSGQFAAELGLLDDWDEKLTYPIQKFWKLGEALSILDVVFSLTEVFGLVSRLAITDIYREERQIVVDVKLCGVKNRILYNRGIYSGFEMGYTTVAENIPYTVTLEKEDSIGRPRELAIEAAQFFFERFSGWKPSAQLLTTYQSELSIHA